MYEIECTTAHALLYISLHKGVEAILQEYNNVVAYPEITLKSWWSQQVVFPAEYTYSREESLSGSNLYSLMEQLPKYGNLLYE